MTTIQYLAPTRPGAPPQSNESPVHNPAQRAVLNTSLLYLPSCLPHTPRGISWAPLPWHRPNPASDWPQAFSASACPMSANGSSVPGQCLLVLIPTAFRSLVPLLESIPSSSVSSAPLRSSPTTAHRGQCGCLLPGLPPSPWPPQPVPLMTTRGRP